MQTRAQMPGRVLVADDEGSVRDLLTRVLGNAGHEVRDHHSHLRAIMITAFPTTASEQAARDLGVHSYVTKPFGIVTIVSAVDEAIRAGRAGR